MLHKLIDSVFNNTNRTFIAVGNKRAYWVKKVSEKNPTFTADLLKQCVAFLINNAFFRVGDLLFRQVIGIPMGSDPAPFFANLFLFYYECAYMDKMRKAKDWKGKKFCHVFRFIDDLLAINDGGEFERLHKEIYPVELELKKENINFDAATYLDLDIKIVDGVFEYKLYDKRKALRVNRKELHIVRFPFLSSNMPNKMVYSTISAEVLRICRATKGFINFSLDISEFFLRMKRQGAKIEGVRLSTKKLLDRHYDTFKKYGLNKEQLSNEILKLW